MINNCLNKEINDNLLYLEKRAAITGISLERQKELFTQAWFEVGGQFNWDRIEAMEEDIRRDKVKTKILIIGMIIIAAITILINIFIK